MSKEYPVKYVIIGKRHLAIDILAIEDLCKDALDKARGLDREVSIHRVLPYGDGSNEIWDSVSDHGENDSANAWRHADHANELVELLGAKHPRYDEALAHAQDADSAASHGDIGAAEKSSKAVQGIYSQDKPWSERGT